MYSTIRHFSHCDTFVVRKATDWSQFPDGPLSRCRWNAVFRLPVISANMVTFGIRRQVDRADLNWWNWSSTKRRVATGFSWKTCNSRVLSEIINATRVVLLILRVLSLRCHSAGVRIYTVPCRYFISFQRHARNQRRRRSLRCLLSAPLLSRWYSVQISSNISTHIHAYE